MSVKIRLSRGGTKKRPYYYIVVADSNSPRDGRYIEQVGTHNPLLPKDNAERVKLNVERLKHWLSVGAQPTDRVLRFLDAAGLAKREARNNPVKAKPRKKRQEREAAAAAGVPVNWVEADMRDLPPGPFDAVINLFSAFGYLESDAADQQVLTAVGQVLRPGGRFILETRNREQVVRTFQPRVWQPLADGSLFLQEATLDLITGRIHTRVTLVEPQAYRPWVKLMQRATLILTDSGGIQEEAPALGKPVLVLRETTERPEGLAAGTARLVGTAEEAIVAAASELLADEAAYGAMARATNPYGDGQAARRIREILFQHFSLTAERG